MGFSDPWKRLKWGFLPVRRVVDEGIDEEQVHAAHSKTEILTDSKAVVGLIADNYETNSIEDEVANPQEYEYRDEADRKWYKFFDEYEYRLPRNKRESRKWYQWYDKNDTKAERRLMIKIDLCLTFISMMVYWNKYLDTANLNNAYIMPDFKEDLGMKGNDLVNTQAIFNVGNIVFQIPFIYILINLPLNYVLPFLDLIWSILTLLTYRVTNVAGLKAIRFFVSVCESGSYLSFQFLFGSFIFNADAMSQRSMVYYLGQYIGTLSLSLLSGAIERGLNGIHGLKAWQWMFIVDGCIGIGVALVSFYGLPGTPNDCYSIFFTDEEIRLLRYRLKQNHTGGSPTNKLKALFNWQLWKEVFTSWELYVLTLWDIFCWCNSNALSGSYLLWVKSLTKIDDAGEVVQRYTGGKLQDITAMAPGVGLAWLFITSLFADQFRSRWGAIIFSQVFNILGNVLLAVWHIPERAKWFAFSLSYFGWAMAPVLYSWSNDINRRNVEKRAIILVVMNALSQACSTWTSVLVWKTVEQPRYLKGFSFTACCAFALCVWTFVVLWFYKKQERKFAKQNGIILYNSNEDPEFLTRLNEKTSFHKVEVESKSSQDESKSSN